MNKTFSEYSTSTAFFVQLSKLQCNALLRVSEAQAAGTDPALGIAHCLSVGTLKGLDARGLVFWNRSATGQANGFGGLTKAGELMVGLLREAGLSIESTNTVSVLKRLAA